MDYNSENTPAPVNYSLKWHKFLIYFALWAGALICIATAGRVMSGQIYVDNGDMSIVDTLYRMYPALKGMGIVFGALYILQAIFMIYTRFQLAKFKAGAPKKLLLVYAINLVLGFGLYIALSSITHVSLGEFVSGSDFVSMFAGPIVIIIANKIYYDKRAELFVH